jgi:Sec-independent protein secretion pathway component TatC
MENSWALDEILILEIFLLIILLIISQIPLFILNSISTEKTISSLPNYWKGFSFFIFLVAGFLTPTIDGYTQISFAGCTLFLYAFAINLLQKRAINNVLPFSSFQ